MILLHFLLGFATAYIGYTPPSMLNLTAIKIGIENDKKAVYHFMYGVSLVVLIQVLLAIFLSSFIKMNPDILSTIEHTAIILFTIVSILFISKGMFPQKSKEYKAIKNSFVFGISLSSINVFSIPFFVIMYGVFAMNGWVETGIFSSSLFGIGSMLGTFSLLNSYVILAQRFEKSLSGFTKYINLSIGTILGLVALYSASNLYF